METEQARPPPPPAPPAPPLPPVGLSSMQASLTNFLAGGRSTSKVSPKRPAAAANFVDKERPALRDLKGMGLTGAMRALDSLRKHNTTASEGDTLGAGGRLDVQERAGLLVLCGCQRGCRFTSDEMNTVQRVTHSMAKVFGLLELQFATLAPKIRGNVGEETHDQRRREVDEFYRTAEMWLALFDDARELAAKKQAELRLEQLSGAAGSPRQAERPQPFPTWLCILIDRYQSQRIEGCHGSGSTCIVGRGGADGEDRPRVHSPPLDAGIAAAHQINAAGRPRSAETAANAAAGEAAEEAGGTADAQHGGATASTALAEGRVDGAAAVAPAAPAAPAERVYPEPGSPAVDSLAKFCRFLALLVASVQEEGTSSTTDKERAALAELIRASDDGSERAEFGLGSRAACGGDGNNGGDKGDEERKDDSCLAAAGPGSPPVGSPGSPRPLRYWGRRIHRFVLSVRELRAVPERDLAILEAIMSEERRGGGRRGRPLSPSPPVPG
ncbi:unnamed protein product [Scytosiphon promiscuus]